MLCLLDCLDDSVLISAIYIEMHKKRWLDGQMDQCVIKQV